MMKRLLVAMLVIPLIIREMVIRRRMNRIRREALMMYLNPTFPMCSPSRNYLTSEDMFSNALDAHGYSTLRQDSALLNYSRRSNPDRPAWDGVAVQAKSLVRFHDDPIPATDLFKLPDDIEKD